MKKLLILFLASLIIISCDSGYSGSVPPPEEAEWEYFKNLNNITSMHKATAGTFLVGTEDGLLEIDSKGKLVKHYTTENGLTSNNITDVTDTNDEYGYYIVATDSGVSVYNYSAWAKHTLEDQGLSSNNITCVAADGNGDVWAGSDNGLNKYNWNNWVTLSFEPGLHGNDIRALHYDGSSLWVGTDLGLFRRTDTDWYSYTENDGLISNDVTSIGSDGNGNVWVGTNAGLSKFDLNNFTHYTVENGLLDNRIRCMYYDPDKGEMWFGTPDGISVLSGDIFINYTEENGLSENNIIDIVEVTEEKLYIATENGISIYDTSFGSYVFHGPASNYISNIVFDEEGLIWAGTVGRGVSVYDKADLYVNWDNYSTYNGLPDNDVNDIFYSYNNGVFIATDEGLAQKTNEGFTVYNETSGLPSDRVLSFYEDLDGNMWFGTNKGVAKYDGANYTIYNQDNTPMENDDVYAIVQDSNGIMWFGTKKELLRLEGDTWTRYDEEVVLLDKEVYKLSADVLGNVYVIYEDSFDGKGVTKINAPSIGNEEIYHFTEADGLPSMRVLGFYAENENTFWFLTADGVGKMVSGEWTYIDITEGDDNECYDMVKDSGGRYWFATKEGVTKYMEK